MAQKKDQNRSTKHTHKTKNRDTRTSLNTGGELRCSGRVSSSCYTSGNRRINLVTNPVIRHGTWLQYWKINVCPCQMMFVSINSKMTGVTSAAVTPNPSRASKFTPELVEFVLLFSFLCSVLQIIIFLFALLRVVIVLSDLRITISDYSFKPFLLFYEVLCRSEFVLFFSFCHCIVCPSINSFRLSLQTIRRFPCSALQIVIFPFALFRVVIVLSELRITISDYPFKQPLGFFV